jgi:hypothetical protein
VNQLQKLFGLVVMDEVPADGGQGGGGDATPAAPAATDAPAAPAAPAEPASLLADLAKPTDEAKPADGGEAKPEDQEAPAVPEVYEFKLPEGEELDEAAAPMVQELFKELGLPQEKAQEVLNKLLEIDKARQPSPEQIQQHYETQAMELNKQWGAECQKLPELGGDNFTKSLETCSQVMVKFATPELRNFLNYSALGSNPEFFKFVHAVGSAMSQDTLEHGGAAAKGQRSLESVLWPSNQ